MGRDVGGYLYVYQHMAGPGEGYWLNRGQGRPEEERKKKKRRERHREEKKKKREEREAWVGSGSNRLDGGSSMAGGQGREGNVQKGRVVIGGRHQKKTEKKP